MEGPRTYVQSHFQVDDVLPDLGGILLVDVSIVRPKPIAHGRLNVVHGVLISTGRIRTRQALPRRRRRAKRFIRLMTGIGGVRLLPMAVGGGRSVPNRPGVRHPVRRARRAVFHNHRDRRGRANASDEYEIGNGQVEVTLPGGRR